MTDIICRYIDCTALMLELLRELPGAGTDIAVHLGDPDPAALRELVRDADVVLNGHTYMGEDVLAAATRLRSIVYIGSGASSYIDMEAAARRRIAVRTIPGYGDRAVAEHAFALLLAAAREVARMDGDIRRGVWIPCEGVELRGRTLGVVGLGGIGREMVRIAAGFGMDVIAWNRTAPAEPLPCALVAIDDLLERCDALSLHLALTPETERFLDEDRIARLKSGAILVNTARGRLVDTEALVAALRSGRLRHAALDVFDAEPLPQDDPLVALPNVTLTAHAAFKTREASRTLMRRALDLAREDMARLAAGRPS